VESCHLLEAGRGPGKLGQSHCSIGAQFFEAPVEGLGFLVKSGFPVVSLGYGVSGPRFRVWGLGFRVQGLGFQVSGLGFGVWVAPDECGR
jgi:hypothetical protein